MCPGPRGGSLGGLEIELCCHFAGAKHSVPHLPRVLQILRFIKKAETSCPSLWRSWPTADLSRGWPGMWEVGEPMGAQSKASWSPWVA